MKKLLVLTFALILALLAGEGFVRYVIGYPVYGVSKKVHYRQGKEYWMNMWKPYSRYWNVEGGNRVFRHNNLGLPGNDIDTTKHNKLAVLGTSFIEAYQIEPKKMATSILDSLLKAKGKDVAIYNLGCSGHDIYDIWFRLKYFQQKHTFQSLMLVVEDDFTNRLDKYQKPLRFYIGKDFGKYDNSLKTIILTGLRNRSTLIFLVSKSYSTVDSENTIEPNKGCLKRDLRLTDEFTECLDNFNLTYGKRFVLVNIAEESEFSADLSVYCRKNYIQYVSRPLLTKDLMLHGSGHLNAAGNHELGILMNQAYSTYLNNTTEQSKAN